MNSDPTAGLMTGGQTTGARLDKAGGSSVPMSRALPQTRSDNIYEVALSCRHAFEEYLDSPRLYRTEVEAFQRQFLTWAGFLGVFAAVSLCLDARLADAPEVKYLLVSMLKILQKNLIHGRKRHSLDKFVSSENDSAMAGIAGAMERLSRLALLIRAPSRPGDVQKVLESRRKRTPDNFDEVILALVKWRFPVDKMVETLQSQLANSIVYRRDRLLYQAKHEAKLSADRNDDNYSESAPTRLQKSLRDWPAALLSVPEERTSDDIPRPQITGDDAGPAAKSAPAPSPLEYIRLRRGPKSVASSTHSTNPFTAAQYPKPPTVPAGHLQAKCNLCCKFQPEVVLTNQKKWRSHVNEDLRPYVCISEDCGNIPPSFAARDEWRTHMQTKHRFDWFRYIHRPHHWICPLNDSTVSKFHSQEDLLEHLKTVHSGDIPGTELAHIAAKSKVPVPLRPHVCPFCAEEVTLDLGTGKVEEASGDVNIASTGGKEQLRSGAATEAKRDLSTPATPDGSLSQSDQNPRLNLISSKTDVLMMKMEKHIESHMISTALWSLRWWDDNLGGPDHDSHHASADSRPKPEGDFKIENGTDEVVSVSSGQVPDHPSLDISVWEEVEAYRRERDNDLNDSFSKTAMQNRTNQRLGEALVENLWLSDWPPGSRRRFMPSGILDSLITRDSVINELFGDHKTAAYVVSSEEDFELVDFVMEGAKKVFAVSLYVGLAGQQLKTEISHLKKHSFNDDALPIRSASIFSPSMGFSKSRFFQEQQWIFLAPMFRERLAPFNYFPSEMVLPFTRTEPIIGFQAGCTHKVRIHELHQEGLTQESDRSLTAAIKPFGNQILLLSDRELEALANISGVHIHPHIAPLKAIFTHGTETYAMSQWADMGSLRDLFREDCQPTLAASFVKNLVQQVAGLADAISIVHNEPYLQRCFMLSPGSILRFGDPTHASIWKMAFMGPVQRNEDTAHDSSPDPPSISYEPPEVLDTPDTWSIGCILLDLIIWILYGPNALDLFNKTLATRVDGTDGPSHYWFLDSSTQIRGLHPTVITCIDRIKHNAECTRSSAIGDLIRIVESNLLVISSPVEYSDQFGSIRERQRATAQELKTSLMEILEKGGEERETYWFTGSERDALTSLFPDSRGRIVVAVDFGTTSSAAAWAWTRGDSTQKPTIHVVSTWPGISEEIERVPTVLQYGDSDNMKWGFECDKEEESFQWFKLEQDPKYKAEQLKRAYPPGTIKPENEHQAKGLITKYLGLLRGHVEKSIRESLGSHGRKQNTLLKGVTWEYIITVPAMWPESAQSITEKCAKDAGMAIHRPVKLIAEPEAAGIYALDQMCQEPGLDVGDTFLICDAGSGTVDLISYTIIQVEPSPVLEEAAAGTGGLCGSSFLDRAFHKWLDNHVSNCRQWNLDLMEAAMEKWETEIKRNFTATTDKKYIIRCNGVDDDPSLSIKGGRLYISTQRMKKIFAQVIEQILGLVDDQIQSVKGGNRQVNTILLAGGFGKNEYLKERIKDAVGKSVRVQRIPHYTTAIVRGALIRGLEEDRSSTTGTPTITVGSRMARKHYGTRALQKYSQELHDPKRPRYPGGVDGGERIDVMRWFFNKNTRVKESQQINFPFYYDQLVDHVEWNGHLDTIKLPIYVSEEDTAPQYPDSDNAQNKLNKRLVEVRADLNRIPMEKLNKHKGEDGKWYYKVDFQIIMTRNLANVTFKLVHDGSEYGTVDAEWDTT